MDSDDDDNKGALDNSALNSVILNYYKKFGRKRDLEQYFSLSTAHCEVRDPTGIFWKNMKTQSDSSDSGGKKSDSSQEVCRISIKCSVPGLSNSQDENIKSRTEPISPPIITFPVDISRPTSRFSDEGSGQSGDDNSQKSIDVLLDSSTNKPLSPSSSVTSQRKLEWDSLADVGYANESDRKTSASSLSTLERLALKQQYSNNETGQNLCPPTAHSTPLDENQPIFKSRKGGGKKITKIYKKDIELVELNVPQNSENKHSHGINVHLTKHISFSVDKNGELVVDNLKKDLNVSPPKVPVVNELTPQAKTDKEIQTTLIKSKENSNNKVTEYIPKPSIFMSVNTLRKKNRRKKLRLAQKKVRDKKRLPNKKESRISHEKIGDQLSEAESFEYMPGHIYNQNHLKVNQPPPNKVAGNKSSLESSGNVTTDSSKGSKHSFTKDLEKSIDLLKAALQQRYHDNLKKKLVKEIIQRLLKSKYRDDESTTDFLSGLSFNSKKLDIQSSTSSTQTSCDSNGTVENSKNIKPKKSILRMDKFNANVISSTSQSAPNLPIATSSDIPVASKFMKQLTSFNTDSDISGGEKDSSGSKSAKTSSEELYRKYLEALRREEAYKKHLKEKEIFLRKKITNSDSALKVPKTTGNKMNSKLKEVINDLIRNNYDDGSGDASKLEGGSDTNMNYSELNVKKQRSHSVFTLSSCNSDNYNKKPNFKKRLQDEAEDLSKPGTSREHNHYCCCPHHLINNKIGLTDSSVQVNLNDNAGKSTEENYIKADLEKKYPDCGVTAHQNLAQIFSDHVTGEIKYVCLCNEKILSQDICDNFLVYKCSRLSNKGVQLNEISKIQANAEDIQCQNNYTSKCIETGSPTLMESKNDDCIQNVFIEEYVSSNNEKLQKFTKSSQTNILLNVLSRKPSDRSVASSTTDLKKDFSTVNSLNSGSGYTGCKVLVPEATRCIQTEISINPQISDPSLPDIKIINDAESVKLISEQLKEVTKQSSVVDICNREYTNDNSIKHNINTNCIKSVCSKEHIDNLCETDVEKESKGDPYLSEINPSNIVRLDINDENNTTIVTDNFTIPIQGTNMKLMVSIGSNDHRLNSLVKEDSSQSNEPLIENIQNLQKSTSAKERSNKIVQYEADVHSIPNIDTINTKYYEDCDGITVNNKENTNDQFPQMNEISNGIDTIKYNTYPLNDKKTLLRSGNEVDNFDASTQTNDEVHKRDAMTQKVQALETDAIPQSYPTKISKYKNAIDRINNNQNIFQISKVVTKDMETQNDFINSNVSEIARNDNLQSSHNKNTDTMSIISNKRQINDTVTSQKMNSYKQNALNKKTQITLKNQVIVSSDIDENTSKSSGESNEKQFISDGPNKNKEKETDCGISKDPILDMIKDITKRYSKDDIQKNKRKKCFKEIVTVLNYLLDTDESTDHNQGQGSYSCSSDNNIELKKPLDMISECCQTTNQVDKAIQISTKQFKNKLCNTDSSDVPASTDFPATSSDTATCKVLNKIKKECEKYHQKRCKSHRTGKKCDASSSTSANCDQCKKVHHCSCRLHKCKAHKSKSNGNKTQKKSVAYNLIIQTSESMISEETMCDNRRPLKNIIVKVPSRRNMDYVPFRELEKKIEKKMSPCSPRSNLKTQRSRSCPDGSEVSSADGYARCSEECTVRDYLEINRPDFVEKCVQRQDCLKDINQSRANERAINRELLSTHVARESPLSALTIDELRQLAREIGIDVAQKKRVPKFLSERDMKRHSENIYKSLPEVTRKKEEVRKENIKKTNLLMANIFKKNLQKKALQGAVNLSNYSKVIKI